MDGTGKTARRRVFYLPGYDPFHPRRYRELYRRESAAQAAISGHRIDMGMRRGKDRFGWHISATIDGARVETEFEVLTWSDIVAASMGSSVLATYGQMFAAYWVYFGSGALPRMARLSRGPAIAAIYPILALVVEFLIALAAGWAAAATLNWLVSMFLPVLAPWPGLAAGGVVLWVTLDWFRHIDGRLYAYYLMHDYALAARDRGAYVPELSARLTEFSGRVAEALTEGWDEVLVVGHSSGASLAVTVLADVIRVGKVPDRGPVLSLLTLGHVVPMISFQPRAQRLRGDLAYLSTRAELFWTDITAPGDGGCFALCDPVAVTGVAPPGKRWPLVLSAAFSQTLSPELRRHIRWRFFRQHFQYLCAFDRPGDYDYFRITAGPETLAKRFGGRAPSKNRIETPMSGYRDIT